MAKEETKRTEISSLGEFGLIERLTKDFKTGAPVAKGVGDDAAVIIRGDEATVITTDLLIEGIHFDLMYMPLKHLGYKAVTVNLSDIAAMNAVPGQVLISIAISNRFSVEAMEELYSGVKAACELYGVSLIGGDTSSSVSGLFISVTAIGTAAKDDVVYRSGAKVGDIICVTGDLGGAYAALQLLEREKAVYLENSQIQPELKGRDYIIARQLKPEARTDVIRIFKEKKIKPTAMIDVSDGLSSDIMHICKQSGTGALIRESDLPIHPETYSMALEFRIDPTMCALNGGEDYELLFTASPQDAEKLKSDPDVTIIGEVLEKKEGIKLVSKGGSTHALVAQGWKAF